MVINQILREAYVISPSYPLKFSGLSLMSGLRSSHPKAYTSNKLGIVPLRGKVVNSSLTNFSRFNGLSNNGIMLKSQVKDRTGFIIDKVLQCKIGRFYTNGCFPDTELFVLFRNSYIIDNLINSFQNLVKNKGLSLEKDTFSLLYNKQFVDENSLLKKHPELEIIQEWLDSLFDDDNLHFNLSVDHDGKLLTTLEAIMASMKKINAGVIMPKQSSFFSLKKVVLEWIAYNTPSLKDCTITP